MGEIRLKIPDTLHFQLKLEAGKRGKRLPDFITRILRDYTTHMRNTEVSEKELNAKR